MSYNVITLPNFEKELKRLARRYPSLKKEIGSLIEDLEESPFLGTDLGNNVREIRLAVQSKGKGKRGGARIMTYIIIVEETLYLFSIL
jgi:mRNA-degrading endonuclease RelE of RelBE toxin-antitoxin system